VNVQSLLHNREHLNIHLSPGDLNKGSLQTTLGDALRKRTSTPLTGHSDPNEVAKRAGKYAAIFTDNGLRTIFLQCCDKSITSKADQKVVEKC